MYMNRHLLPVDDIGVGGTGQHPTRVYTEHAVGVTDTLTAGRLPRKKVCACWITTHECLIVVNYCERSVRMYRRSMPKYVKSTGSVRYRHESILHPITENGEPLKHELSAFVMSVKNESEPTVAGSDSLRVVDVTRRIDALATGSGTEGVTVEVSVAAKEPSNQKDHQHV
jgi:hypothetical protein